MNNYYHFFITITLPTTSTLFPYTTLFRSTHHPSRGMIVHDLPTFGEAPEDKGEEAARRFLALSSGRSEEDTSELQSHSDIVCRLLLEKKKLNYIKYL